MEVKGLNATGEFFDENNVTVQTLINNLRKDPFLRKYDLERYYEEIVKLYNTIFSTKIEKTTLPIISAGTLFHLSPVKDLRTGEVFYDKMESIGKNGLLSMDMLVDLSDATDHTYVSFHSVLEGEKSYQDVVQRLKTGKVEQNLQSVTFFINTNTPAIQKLIRIGRYYGQPELTLTFKELLSQNNEELLLHRMFARQNSYCPDNLNVKGVHYLPIGVPSSYVSAIRVPDGLLDDERLMRIFVDNFTNAVILDSNMQEVNPQLTDNNNIQ